MCLRDPGQRSDLPANQRGCRFYLQQSQGNRITLKNDQCTHQVTALSLGGGMIEIVEINGAAVSMQGDFWETLVFVPAAEEHFLGEQDSLLQK